MPTLTIIFSLLALLISPLGWMYRRIGEFHRQNFAEKILWLPLVWVLVMWGVFVTASPIFKFVSDLLLSVWEVAFLIMILHPQKMIQTETRRNGAATLRSEAKKSVTYIDPQFVAGVRL